MDDHLRPRLAHQARDRLRLAQVVLARPRRDDIAVAGARQLLEYEAAEKPRATSDQDARVFGGSRFVICHFVPPFSFGSSLTRFAMTPASPTPGGNVNLLQECGPVLKRPDQA